MLFFRNSVRDSIPSLARVTRLSPHSSLEDDNPKRKTPYILHPQSAPKTIRRNRDYPSDFHLYEFAGPMIEQVRCTGKDGEEIRCPALVARMIRKTEFLNGAMMGAKSLEEMTCSIKDLKTYKDLDTGVMGHPDSDKIAQELASYYESKIYSKQREDESTIVETEFSRLGSNSFFHAMNPQTN